MDVRQAKQLIYGSFFLIIMIGIVVGIYFSFFRAAPSCFDNIQNQGEQGVDCGGPCTKVCVPSDIGKIATTGPVIVFLSSPGHYTLLAQVANTNQGFAAQSFNYTFNLYSDSSNTLIESVPGQSFIYGAEVKYLLAPNLPVAVPVDHATLSIENPQWVTTSVMGLIPQFGNPLAITDSSVGSSTLRVSGYLTDGDIASFTKVIIIGIFYDTNNNPVGASETELNSISPNQTEDFTLMYPIVPNVNLALTKVFAYALRQ